MSKYDNLRKDELIEALEDRDEKLIDLKDELEQVREEMEDLRQENLHYESQLAERETQEGKMERTFNAGFDACENKETKMKAWLNFKIGERL